nr:hypothetical protein [Tanacetum cinerariifolium]
MASIDRRTEVTGPPDTSMTNTIIEAAKKVGLKAKAKTYKGKTNQDVPSEMEKYKKGITICSSSIESIQGNCSVERRSSSEHEQSNSDLEVTFLEEVIVIFTTVSWCKERIILSLNDNAFDLLIVDEAGHRSNNRGGDLPRLTSFLFYNVVDGVEQKPGSSTSSSFYNERECVLCYLLYKELQDRMKLHGGKDEICVRIITPYMNQVECIKRQFVRNLNEQDLKNISFETIDAFQGQERDIIILSCVRTKDLGFVADRKRMNVALTRAKRALWVLGKKTALLRSKTGRHSSLSSRDAAVTTSTRGQ